MSRAPGADGTATIWKHSGEVQQVLQGHEDNVLMAPWRPVGDQKMGRFLILEELGTGWNRLEGVWKSTRCYKFSLRKKSVGIVFSHLVEETINTWNVLESWN